ncbi:hypothetical protein MIR68_012571 [Amoeboaphelidium protococcarum]|nr:hypothetical protein MIR68_012571 [Amoeboaphelidium protococcarum]
MSLDVACVGIVGPKNNPLYVKNYADGVRDITMHYIVHTVLDMIEDKLQVGGNVKNSELYMGLLYALEEYNVYGQVSNTKVKFIVIIHAGDNLPKDADIKALLRNINIAYQALTFNPFYEDVQENGRMIDSRSFDDALQRIVTRLR